MIKKAKNEEEKIDKKDKRAYLFSYWDRELRRQSIPILLFEEINI